MASLDCLGTFYRCPHLRLVVIGCVRVVLIEDLSPLLNSYRLFILRKLTMTLLFLSADVL